MVPENEEQPVIDDRPTLREVRVSYGFTVREIEALTGVNNSTIVRIEKSYDPEYLTHVIERWGTFKESTFAKIARGLDMQVCEIRWPCDGSDSRHGAMAGDRRTHHAPSTPKRKCLRCFLELPSGALAEVVICDDCA